MTFSDARRRAISETNKTGKWMYVSVTFESGKPKYVITDGEGLTQLKSSVTLGHSKVSFDDAMNTRVVFVESRLEVASSD